MIIGGLEKLSLIDYPDHIAAIIFTTGCNFRCHYCHNPMLVLPRKGAGKKNKKEEGFSPLGIENLFLFLRERFGRLDGVVITGGEPTLHASLPDFIKEIKSIGYDVKLDTNGTNPLMLKKLIKEKLVDYIAMDLKAPLSKYEEVVGAQVDCDKVQKSVKIIVDSKLPHEFRTTVVPELLNEADIREMAQTIKGAKNWYLQAFISNVDLVNQEYKNKKGYSNLQLKKLAKIGQEVAGVCNLRD